MHELTITQNIVDIATNEAKNRKITAINLVIGELTSVVEESIRFCFAAVSEGTLAEGAVLSLVKVPALMECRGCSCRFGTEKGGICPTCGGFGGEVVQGRELYVESIEVEEGRE